MPGNFSPFFELLGRSARAFRFRPLDAIAPHPDDDWTELSAESETATTARAKPLDLLPDPVLHPDDWPPFVPEAPDDPAPQQSAAIPDVVGASDFSDASSDDLDGWFDERSLPATADDTLPDFPIDVPEPTPRQSVPTPSVFDPAKRLALLRASRMVDRLDIAERRRREQARLRLAAIFEQFPAGSSVAAIGRAIDAGASIMDVEAMAQIRTLWSEDPGLWLLRSYSKEQGWTVRGFSRAAAAAMTWRLAARLLRLGSPEMLVDKFCGTWRDEWLALRARSCMASDRLRPAFYSYPAYLEYRASLAGADVSVEAYTEDGDADDGRIVRHGARLSATKAFPLLGDRTQLRALIWTSSALHPSLPPPRNPADQAPS